MNWKAALKPTKIKLLLSIGIVAAWWVISYFWFKKMVLGMTCICLCEMEFPILLLPNCCPCSSFSRFITQLIVLLLPGIITYLVYSFVQKHKKKQFLSKTFLNSRLFSPLIRDVGVACLNLVDQLTMEANKNGNV